MDYNYVDLSNIKGGRNEQIRLLSGPVEIVYMINKDINKKVIIMGDNHENKEGICSDTSAIDLIDYIDSIKSSCDLFLESEFYDIQNIDETDINRFISLIVNYGKKNYKKKDNMRIHFTDVRGSTPLMLYLTRKFYHRTHRVVDILANDLKEKTNAINAFIDITHDFVNMLDSNYEYSRNGNLKKYDNNEQYKKEYINLYISKMFIKQMDKLDKNIQYKLLFIFQNYLAEVYDLIWNDKRTEYRDWSKDPMLATITYNKIFDAGALFADMYTIARIMKGDQYNNNILYVGAGHIPGIIKMLKAIGFNIKYHNESNKKNMRCVEFIDFDEFFS